MTLVLEEEPDQQGVPRIRVKWVNKLGGASLANQMNPAERKTFAARMRGVVAEVKPAVRAPAASTGPRPPNGARPQGAQEWDGTGADPMADNIPFISRGAWLWVGRLKARRLA